MTARPQPWGDAKPQDMSIIKDLDRLRVEYIKDDRLAYLGHLEVLETINRCIRRAQLPFSIGNGFARRMRIQFSQALPVGASSCCEYFDLRLNEFIEPQEALAHLAAATPPALAPRRAAYIEGRVPALEAWLNRADWDVRLDGAGVSCAQLVDLLHSTATQGTLNYMRGEKPKSIDLASALVGFSADQDGEDLVLCLQTRSSNEGALRPKVLLDAALSGIEHPYRHLKVARTAQHHETADGHLVNPL